MQANRRRMLGTWSALLASLLVGSIAEAEGTRVIILGAVPGVAELESELRSVELVPFEVLPDAQASHLDLLQRHRARGLITLGPRGETVEIAIAHGGRLRQESLPRRPGERWDITVIRVVEFLRAWLLPLPPSPERPERGPPSRVRRFSLRLGAGPTLSPGGMVAQGHLWLVPGLRAARWLEVELSLLFPVASAEVSGVEGTAAVQTGLALAGARVLLAGEDRRLRPSLMAGAGLSLMHVEGTAVAPYTGGDDWVASFALAAGAGLALRLQWRLWLQLDALLGVALPQQGVEFAGRAAATWGRPFALTSLGLGVRL